MGQYHVLVNLDRHEYVDPHALGCGLKLVEMFGTFPGVGQAMIVLMASSNGRGGGDFYRAYDKQGKPTDQTHSFRDDYRADFGDDVVGRWVGDRVAIVGNDSEPSDIPGLDAQEVYRDCQDGETYTNISARVAEFIERHAEGHYEGQGWKTWEPRN